MRTLEVCVSKILNRVVHDRKRTYKDKFKYIGTDGLQTRIRKFL